jgi:hypothetical protein
MKILKVSFALQVYSFIYNASTLNADLFVQTLPKIICIFCHTNAALFDKKNIAPAANNKNKTSSVKNKQLLLVQIIIFIFYLTPRTILPSNGSFIVLISCNTISAIFLAPNSLKCVSSCLPPG